MISLRLDSELLDAIDRAAAVEERSRNWMINDLLRRGLAAVRTEEAVNQIGEQLIGPDVLVQQEAIKPTLDQRRAEKQRPPRLVPSPPGPEGVDGGPAHRHRYNREVEGTRQGRAGIIQADFTCSCGLTRRQPVNN